MALVSSNASRSCDGSKTQDWDSEDIQGHDGRVRDPCLHMSEQASLISMLFRHTPTLSLTPLSCHSHSCHSYPYPLLTPLPCHAHICLSHLCWSLTPLPVAHTPAPLLILLLSITPLLLSQLGRLCLEVLSLHRCKASKGFPNVAFLPDPITE